LKTPIALDESVHTLADTRKAIELKSARILNIKICRVGGLANSIAIHNICQQAGWPVWVGGMMDMGIGAAVKIEFASLPNVTLPGDIAPSDRYFIEDIVDPPVLLSPDGTYEVSKKPGIGRTIKESFVREKSIAGFTLRA
jgi:O-succinylbenzoate synthase